MEGDSSPIMDLAVGVEGRFTLDNRPHRAMLPSMCTTCFRHQSDLGIGQKCTSFAYHQLRHTYIRNCIY